MTGPTADKPAVVYRAYDEDGELLYIGCTVAGVARLWGHKAAQADWWPRTRHLTIDHYPDGLTALEAEARAIYDERPSHNVVSPRVQAIRWENIENARLSGMTWPQVARQMEMTEESLARRVARMRKAGRSRV